MGELSRRRAGELCKRAVKGDDAAFAELYEAVRRILYGTAYRFRGLSPQERDDAAQTTLIHFRYKALKDYDPARGDFAAFAALVFRRQLVTAAKSVRRTRRARFHEAMVEGDAPAPGTAWDGGHATIFDNVADPKAVSPDRRAELRDERAVRRRWLREVAPKLSPLERLVLSMLLRGKTWPEIEGRLRDSEFCRPRGKHHGYGKGDPHKVVDNALQRVRAKLAGVMSEEDAAWLMRRRRQRGVQARRMREQKAARDASSKRRRGSGGGGNGSAGA